jgi:hypothetical protein
MTNRREPLARPLVSQHGYALRSGRESAATHDALKRVIVPPAFDCDWAECFNAFDFNVLDVFRDIKPADIDVQ